MAGKPTEEQLARVIEPLDVAVRESDSYLQPLVESGITVKFLVEKCYSIKRATKYLKVAQDMYIRQLVWKAKLEGVKVWMGSYEKWFITQESLDYYKEHNLRRTKPKKYILKTSPDTYDKVMAFLEDLGEPFELYPNYRPKKKGGDK